MSYSVHNRHTVDMDQVKKVKIDLEVKDMDKPKEHEITMTGKPTMTLSEVLKEKEKVTEKPKMIIPFNLKSLIMVLTLSLLVFLLTYSVCACVVKKNLHGLELVGFKQCLCDFLQFLVDKIDESIAELGGGSEPDNTVCMLLGILFLLSSGIVFYGIQIHQEKKYSLSDFKDTPKESLEGSSGANQGPLTLQTPIPTLANANQGPMTLQASIPTLADSNQGPITLKAPIPHLSPTPNVSEIPQLSHEEIVAAMKLWNGSAEESDVDQPKSAPTEPRISINGDPGPHPILLKAELPKTEASKSKNSLNSKIAVKKEKEEMPGKDDKISVKVDVDKLD